jgi:FkbM family methyltransferase
MPEFSISPVDLYQQYLQRVCPKLSEEIWACMIEVIEKTNWDEPASPLDWNNVAVIMLLEASQCDDLSVRAVYLEMATEALNNGIDEHPLCIAHLALVYSMIGNRIEAFSKAFPCFLNTLQYIDQKNSQLPIGLIFLPVEKNTFSQCLVADLLPLIEVDHGGVQALRLLSEILYRCSLVYYSDFGLRCLSLATQVLPNSVSIHLKLGIARLTKYQAEGLFNLHRAYQLSPQEAPVLQALYLTYLNLEQTNKARFWLQKGQDLWKHNTSALEWQWASLSIEDDFTYVPFENRLRLVIEANFKSIVTSTLIATGDWFEDEMEWWRTWLKPGMTVIDVGANVGVYTFSAALRVGENGRVIAVEPFAKCVESLQKTCEMNQIKSVSVWAGAASDRNGSIRFSVKAASELNEVVPDQVLLPSGEFTEVPCFTLDSLIDREKIEQVDVMKLDAEGHEVAVLKGCQTILSRFLPVILYENIAGSQGDNIGVAQFLKEKGYQLHSYQPFLQALVPVNSLEDLKGQLNIIALPPQ